MLLKSDSDLCIPQEELLPLLRKGGRMIAPVTTRLRAGATSEVRLVAFDRPDKGAVRRTGLGVAVRMIHLDLLPTQLRFQGALPQHLPLRFTMTPLQTCCGAG